MKPGERGYAPSYSEKFMIPFSSRVVSAITAVLATVEGVVLTSWATASATITVLQPDSGESNAIAALSEKATEDYIRRVGQVVFTAKDLFSPQPDDGTESVRMAQSLKQSELVLAFFPDQDFRIIVDTESSSGNGMLSLGGRRITADLATFSMTVTSDTYLITFQDLDSGMTYKVVGNMKTGTGRVTEYDLAKLPPVYDGNPIIPPPE